MKEIITWVVDIFDEDGEHSYSMFYRKVAGADYWSEDPPMMPLWRGVPEKCPKYKSYISEDEDKIGEPYLMKIKYIPESYEFEKL